jgi:hypothetical protein
MKPALILTTVALVFFNLICDGVVRAQFGLEGAEKKKDKKKDKRPNSNPISSLTILAEAGTLITLTPVLDSQAPQPKKGKGNPDKQPPSQLSPQRKNIPAGQNSVRFDKLPPGRYRVLAELEGYQSKEQEVQLMRDKNSPLTLALRRLTYNVVIKTNADSGEIRYRATGEVWKLAPLKQGRAELNDLPAGQYEVEIRPEGTIWRPLTDQITVGPNQSAEVSFGLKRQVCRDVFEATWFSLADWLAPKEWSVSTTLRLLINGPGVAWPRNEHLHCFADFKLVSDVWLRNDIAISFVLRAQDSQNYYLIRLTGRDAEEPYLLRGFTVINGMRQPWPNAVPLHHLAKSLSGKFFEIHITATGNRFDVLLRDQGEDKPLGFLIDQDRRFAIGAIGLAAQEREQNEIFRFIVEPSVTDVR